MLLKLLGELVCKPKEGTMKLSHQLLLLTLLLCVSLVSGCSKEQRLGLDPARITSVQVDSAGPSSTEEVSGSLGVTPEERLSEADAPDSAAADTDERTDPEDMAGVRRDFGGMPGDGSTGSFSAEPFGGSSGTEPFGGSSGTEPFSESSGVEPFSESTDSQGSGLDSADEEARRLPYRSSDHLKDIHFAFDRYELDDQSRAVLRENATYLKSHPESRVEIQGHCDERGTNNYNVALGQRRAHSTKSYLAAQGIDDSRIHIVSYGEEKPFCFDSNENCWWQNRRAHFLVAE